MFLKHFKTYTSQVLTEYFMYSIVVSPLIIIFALLLPPGKNEPVIEKANLAFILVITVSLPFSPKRI